MLKVCLFLQLLALASANAGLTDSEIDSASNAAAELLSAAVDPKSFPLPPQDLKDPHLAEEMAMGLSATPDSKASDLESWVKFSDGDGTKILRANGAETTSSATVAADGTVSVVRASPKEEVMSQRNPTTRRGPTSQNNFATLHPDTPLVMMYDTEELPEDKKSKGDGEHVVHLLSQLEAVKWPYMMIGGGTTWEGWCSKVPLITAELDKLNPDQLVIISDARDVLVNPVPGGKEDFGKRFKERFEKDGWDPSPLVVNAEGDCCVAAMNVAGGPGTFIDKKGNRKSRSCTSGYGKCLHRGKDYDSKWEEFFKNEAKKRGFAETKFPYLNAGMLVGRAKSIKLVYEWIQATPEEDDQALLSEVFAVKPKWQKLDYEQALFGTNRWIMGADEGCLYDWEKNPDGTGQFKNKITGETPHFIHTSGKFWDCYKKLEQKMDKEQKTKDQAKLPGTKQLNDGANCDPYQPNALESCNCDVHLWWSWPQCVIKTQQKAQKDLIDKPTEQLLHPKRMA